MTKRGGAGRSNRGDTTTGGGAELPPPDDRVLLFADSLQHERAEQDERLHQWEMWVTCRIEREVFALPVKQVQEILRVSALTRVPHAPFPVRGVTNLRGYVLPVVDLRVRLGMPAEEPGPRHRVMVVHSRGRLIGLLVDAVEQVTQIDRLAVEPVPDDVMTAQSYYLLGVYHVDDSEMAAALACGVGPSAMYVPVSILTVLVTVIMAWLTLFLAPESIARSLSLRAAALQQGQFAPVVPGRFRTFGGSDVVVRYIGDLGDPRFVPGGLGAPPTINDVVSVNRFGTGSGNNASFHPVISPDGQRIMFLSYATDLTTNLFPGTPRTACGLLCK